MHPSRSWIGEVYTHSLLWFQLVQTVSPLKSMSVNGRTELGCLQVPHALIMPPVPPGGALSCTRDLLHSWAQFLWLGDGINSKIFLGHSLNHRIIESIRLEKTSKIIKSNHQSSTTMPTKPRGWLSSCYSLWYPDVLVSPVMEEIGV